MIYLFILGRIIVGGYFIMNGYNHFKNLGMLTGYAQSKGVPMAKQAVLLTGLMMLLGGAGIVLGVYVKLSILLVSVFLFGVSFTMHRFWTISDQMARMGEEINFKKNIALMGAMLMILAIPLPWAVSLMM